MTTKAENLLDKMSFMDMITEGDNLPPAKPSGDDGIDDPERIDDLDDKPIPPVKPADKPKDTTKPVEDEVEDDTQADDEPGEGLIGTMAKTFGINFEEGETYEDTEDGLISFTKKAAEQMAMQNLEELFEKLPDVQEYLQYRMDGGDPSKYHTAQAQTDYVSAELKEDDVRTQKAVLSDLLKRQGYDKAEIDETLQDYEDTGILFKQSKKAQTKLSTLVESERAQVVQSQAKAAAEREKENVAYWSTIQKTIESGELKGIKIPETEKKKFYDWINKPVDKQGNTARAVARKEMDTQTVLALEYMFYKNLDLGSLVTAKAKTIQAQTLRDKLNTGSTGNRMGKSVTKPTRQVQLPSTESIF